MCNVDVNRPLCTCAGNGVNVMDAREVLESLTFGSVDSESEDDLDRLFVRTGDFDKFLKKNVWLVLGAKGTGKSALFELFAKFESTARGLSGEALNDVVIATGTGFGDLSEITTEDIQGLKESNENFDHDRLWRLYIAVKAGLALKNGHTVPAGPLKELLVSNNERKDYRIGPLLKDLWRQAIGDPPDKISIKGIRVDARKKKRQLDVIALLQDVNSVLASEGKVLWLLFDKVDEIWSDNKAERRKSLSRLIEVVMYVRRSFPAIQPKILLRTDIWQELDFTNKDHLTDKCIELSWTRKQLSDLLVKRAIQSELAHRWVSSRVPEVENCLFENWTSEERSKVLESIFPATAYPGEREAAIMDWIVERVKDGRGTVLPRDAINIANYAAEYQRSEALEPGNPTLISRDAIRRAFSKASEVRCNSFLAEFPELHEHFRRFAGQTKAEFSREELLDLMKGLKPRNDELLERLYEIGVVRPDTGRVLTASSYQIPRLYRSGLGLIIRGRP